MFDSAQQPEPGRKQPKGLSVGCAVVLILGALGILAFGTCLALLASGISQHDQSNLGAMLIVVVCVVVAGLMMTFAVRGAIAGSRSRAGQGTAAESPAATGAGTETAAPAPREPGDGGPR